MITGKLPDGTELNKNLKKPFFNMNKYISPTKENAEIVDIFQNLFPEYASDR